MLSPAQWSIAFASSAPTGNLGLGSRDRAHCCFKFVKPDTNWPLATLIGGNCAVSDAASNRFDGERHYVCSLIQAEVSRKLVALHDVRPRDAERWRREWPGARHRMAAPHRTARPGEAERVVHSHHPKDADDSVRSDLAVRLGVETKFEQLEDPFVACERWGYELLRPYDAGASARLEGGT